MSIEEINNRIDVIMQRVRQKTSVEGFAAALQRQQTVQISMQPQQAAQMQTACQSCANTGAMGTNIPSEAQKYMPYVAEASEKFGMPQNLILGIMNAESSFNNECVSYAGAKGLMQLMPETAAEVGVSDVFDPRQNILGGVEYVQKLIDKYGDVKVALCAYNTGPAKVDRRGVTSSTQENYLTIPQSIRDYADRVIGYANQYAGV